MTRIQELAYEFRVGDVMKKEVITVAPSMPMADLRAVLRENRVSGVPAVEDGELAGVISIEDFITWLADGARDCTVAECMTKAAITVCADEPLIQAVSKLERLGYGRLPVVARGSGKLIGVITKGDIIAGVLRKLDIDYRNAELRNARSSHIFEDIVADRSALILDYDVIGGDMKRAGGSATGLKTTLLRLGIDPRKARRAAIATYEAEMNLIFFADGGTIKARVEPEMINIVVEDQGPGIEDIDQAMQPGFSTAPDSVRELGFGAGMGLQNIRMASDRMTLDSTVGKGTRLEIEISLESKSEAA